MYRIVLISLLVFNLFLFYILPVKDNDFGWHYRCGEEFLTGGKLCLSNDYSYFLPNYHWAYPSFLYDIGLAGVFDHFGFAGISVLGAAVFTGIFMIYFFLLKGPLVFRLIFMAAFSVFSWSIFSLGYRSQILGVLFFVTELFMLKRALWLLPILFFLWANTHASFFLGPLVLAVYGLKKHWFIFIIGVAATLINPFGWRIYQELIQHLRVPLNTMIAEWVGPTGWQTVFLVISMLVAAILVFRKRTLKDYKILLLIIFGILAFSARRNMPLYYLTFFIFLSEQLNSKELEIKYLEDFKMVVISILAGAVLFFSLRTAETLVNDGLGEGGYCRNLSLPCEAAKTFAFDKSNIFNTYEWGGYFIWKLPANKVFVDGRMPAWQDENGESPYAVFLAVLQTQPGWDERLTQLNTKYIFIGRGTFLDLLLQKESKKYGWEEKYRDKTAVIYEKI